MSNYLVSSHFNRTITIFLNPVLESTVPKKAIVKSQPVFSLDALLEENAEEHIDLPQVKSAAVSAMRLLMLGNQQGYINEIYRLADFCAQLLNQGAPINTVVNVIKFGMANSYQQALDKVTSEIGLGQFQLTHSNPQTLAGQNLQKRVNTMRHYKDTPFAEITEAVITDSFVQASARFGADIGNFDFINCRPGN